MALKNRRTQKNKTNRRKQQSKRGGKRMRKNTKKNVRNKRQSRRRMRGGVKVGAVVGTIQRRIPNKGQKRGIDKKAKRYYPQMRLKNKGTWGAPLEVPFVLKGTTKDAHDDCVRHLVDMIKTSDQNRTTIEDDALYNLSLIHI